MAKKIYYEKVGRRYKPVFEYDSDFLDSFPRGNHLVMSYPGGKSRRYNIDPALAPMIAAGRYAEDSMCEVLRKASEAKPIRQPLTEKQVKAWRKMQKEMGDEVYYLQYPSNRDIVEAGVRAMCVEADKLLQHPSVRDSYDKFMMICKLVYEEQK